MRRKLLDCGNRSPARVREGMTGGLLQSTPGAGIESRDKCLRGRAVSKSWWDTNERKNARQCGRIVSKGICNIRHAPPTKYI